MQKAFTLIELLVVVLIIGILAAVALPQYRVAVAKSRYVQVKVAGEALQKAQQIYYLANGTYPTNFDDLDISLGTPTSTSNLEVEGYGFQSVINFTWGHCTFQSYGTRIQCTSSYANVPEFTIFSPNNKNCSASSTNNVSKQVCASDTGDSSPTENGSWYSYTY